MLATAEGDDSGRYPQGRASQARPPCSPQSSRAWTEEPSLARSDIVRLSRLAERDRLSQAKLIAKALDAYEALYGIGD